jgi:hypothetical protein
MNREQRNYQFDFLRPQHSLFQYFTKLLEQYTKASGNASKNKTSLVVKIASNFCFACVFLNFNSSKFFDTSVFCD